MKTKVTYTHFTRGLLQGFVGYVIDLNTKKLTVQQTTGPLYALSVHHRHCAQSKSETPVWITGENFPPPAAMIGILQPLRDQGFYIVADVNASSGYLPWYSSSLVNHLIVRLTGEKWTAFKCKEIWYTPSVHVDPPFVTDPPPALYLDLKTITPSIVGDFLKNNPQPWRILTEVERKFSEEVV